MQIGKTGQYAIIGVIVALAIALIVWFTIKKDKPKDEQAETDKKNDTTTTAETTKTGNFSGEESIIKRGSKGKKVEQLQYFLQKKYNEIYGEKINFDNIGTFDQYTENVLKKLTEKTEIDKDIFDKLRINSFKTYKFN